MKEDAILIKAVVLSKDKKIGEAVKLLKKFASANIANQLKTKLTAVQLLLAEVSIVVLCFGNTLQFSQLDAKFMIV